MNAYNQSTKDPILHVFIIKATNLRKHNKLCDAYVKLSFSHGDKTHHTKVIEDNKSPEWNEHVTFNVGNDLSQSVLAGESFFLRLTVYDKDDKKDHFLGEVKVSFRFRALEFESNEGKLFENVPLENTIDGSVTFAIKTKNFVMN